MKTMMYDNIPSKLFVTGTDTGVGKTLVSAILMAGLKGMYWKPIQSGLEDITDTNWIRRMTGLPHTHFHPETYRLALPLSPHASAKAEDVSIDLDAFRLPESSSHLIIEGAGGIMVPLNETHFMIDLIKKLAIPVLLVARSELGTINHTLLSLEQLRRHDIDIVGVVINGVANQGNKDAIEQFGKVKVLAEIEPMKAINPKILQQAFQNFTVQMSSEYGSKAII